MMYGAWDGWTWWLPMGLSMIVLWGGVFALIWALSKRRTPQAVEHASAVEVLDRRYARGEIDESEWRHRRDLLGHTA